MTSALDLHRHQLLGGARMEAGSMAGVVWDPLG